MPHIFISYAKKDARALALELDAALNAQPGVTAWVDRMLVEGADWATQIQRQIDRCDIFLALLSPDVNRETQPPSFVLKEIHYAQQAGKLIIPIMAAPTTMPVQLAGIQYLDFTRDPAAAKQRLLALVMNWQAAPSSPSAPLPAPAPDIRRQKCAPLLLALLALAIGGAVLAALRNADGSPDDVPTNTLTAVATATPTPEVVPSRTPAPTATPTAAPTAALLPLRLDALGAVRLLDVAASGDTVWFASDQGVLSQRPGEPPRVALGGTLRALAYDPRGAALWAFGDNPGSLYRFGQGMISQVNTDITGGFAALAADDDGTLWLADTRAALYRLLAEEENSRWLPLNAPTGSIPAFEGVHRLSAATYNGQPTLLVIATRGGITDLYVWREGRWTQFDNAQLCRATGCVIMDAALDGQGRLWVAHSAGLTRSAADLRTLDFQLCGAGQSPLLNNAVHDLAFEAVTGALWLVTAAELARLDVSDSVLPADCATWGWQRWDEFGFWTENPTSEYRLALGGAGARTRVWLIERGSSRARMLGILQQP